MPVYIQGRVRANTADEALQAMCDDLNKRGLYPVGAPRLWKTEQTLQGLPWIEYGTLAEHLMGGEETIA